ncbi:MAG: sialidase family protein [Candidatus Cryptobacteroides sp.]
MKTGYTLPFAIIIGVALVLSCTRELDLAHKYDNTESSRPWTDDEEEEPSNPSDPGESLDFTDCGSYMISERVDVNVPSSVPRGPYMLDGKITVSKLSSEETFTTVWSSDFSMFQRGCATPWLEDNISSLTSSMAVIGKGISEPIEEFTDGGIWFIGVHQLDDGTLAGFFHGESHYSGIASQYKSIGVAYSSDGGKSWDKGSKILSGPDPKPEVGEGNGKSYGLGDGCVVWNDKRKEWICYYSGYCDDPADFVISMASSSDAKGLPGTWKKWDGTAFSLEGCNQATGLGAPNIKLENLWKFRGGNPSVSWNSAISRWIMVYHTWSRNIVMSTSTDGITWTEPVTIIDHIMEAGGSMYPNIISEDGDLLCGKEFRIYYSTDMDSSGRRKIAYRIVRLKI